MSPLNEAPLAAEAGINAHALVTFGIAAIALYFGWRIVRSLAERP